MTPFTTLTSPATPFFRDGVTTDVIYAGPRADLQTGVIEKNIFKHFRYDEAGRARPESLFDKPPFAQSAVLIVARGFGRGKTPDIAARALAQLGYVCIIGNSFAPVFEEQALAHEILPITLDYEIVKWLADQAGDGDAITIDLPAEKVITYHGDRISFHADPAFRGEMLASAAKLKSTRSKIALKSHKKRGGKQSHLFYAAAALR